MKFSMSFRIFFFFMEAVLTSFSPPTEVRLLCQDIHWAKSDQTEFLVFVFIFFHLVSTDHWKRLCYKNQMHRSFFTIHSTEMCIATFGVQYFTAWTDTGMTGYHIIKWIYLVIVNGGVAFQFHKLVTIRKTPVLHVLSISPKATDGTMQ